jgi:3-methylcrotonyl-CoA carboxylase alpha subunit/geranyl-CoA carboxylase alpha subunit
VVRGSDGHHHVRWGAHDLRLQDLSHTAAVASGSGPAARELRAPFNGKLVAVAAQPGERVARGQTLLTIESMKIEHQIAAPRDGTLAAVAVAPGQQVGPGQVLVIFEAEAA